MLVALLDLFLMMLPHDPSNRFIECNVTTNADDSNTVPCNSQHNFQSNKDKYSIRSEKVHVGRRTGVTGLSHRKSGFGSFLSDTNSQCCECHKEKVILIQTAIFSQI